MPRIHWVARGTGIPKDKDEAEVLCFFPAKKKNSKKLLRIESWFRKNIFFSGPSQRFSVESCVEEI
jgi:hypothetical protein